MRYLEMVRGLISHPLIVYVVGNLASKMLLQKLDLSQETVAIRRIISPMVSDSGRREISTNQGLDNVLGIYLQDMLIKYRANPEAMNTLSNIEESLKKFDENLSRRGDTIEQAAFAMLLIRGIEHYYMSQARIPC